MKLYHVKYTREAEKNLRKMDAAMARMIVAWVRKNLEGCTDPRRHGKGLMANRSGEWRYRVGDCRLIAQIEDSTVTILMLSVGHRSEVYN